MRKGETFMSICLSYGLAYQRLIDLNLRFLNLDVLDNYEIQPGKTIVIGDSADPLDLIRLMERAKRK